MLVNGASRLIGDAFVNKIQITTISAPTSSGGTTYGPGTSGQVLKSDGSSIYWTSLGSAASYGVTDSSSASAISTGTNLTTERDVYYGLPTINNSHAYTSNTTIYAPTAGGTANYVLWGNGTTSAPIWKAPKDALNYLINSLDTGSSNLTSNDYVITQYVGGGTTTTTYHRRPASAIRVGGLLTARKLKVALGSTTDVTFDGTSDQTSIPVSGTLAIANGGTGATTAAAARTNLGAVNIAGDTMTGNLAIQKAGETYVQVKNSTTGSTVLLNAGSSTNHGLWSNGYYTGSSYISDAKWIVYRDWAGDCYLNGKADTATTGKYLWSGFANPVYGTNRLEYFNANGTQATPTANATAYPTSDWYHFLRMNHGDSRGYYVEIASHFHSDNMYWRRVAAGTAYDWKKVAWADGTNSSGTWGISITGNAGYADSAGYANKLGTSSIGNDSHPIYLNAGTPTQCASPISGSFFQGIPVVNSDGVMEIGKYIDFHASHTDTSDYSVRLTATTTDLTSSKDLCARGYLKSTANSNTITIGSQNTDFCHIYNSANIPFIFNNSILTTGGSLGNVYYPFNNLTLGHSNEAGIYYTGTKNTYRMIRFIDNTTDANGNGISIGGGGQTIIGGGESADTAAAQAGTAGAEIMQVCNDGDVQIISNLQDGWNNRKVSTFNTTGNLTLPAQLICANSGNTTGGSYTESGLEIREYNYGLAQSDTWGNAPRMTFHWGGRVQAQIGLASNGWLYTTAGYGGDLTTNRHRFVIEQGGTWDISVSGNAATAIKATQDQNGYNLNDSYRKEFVSAIDLSSLNVNTWYPVVAILPASGFRRLSCVVHLNSGTVPSWSVHDNGFTAVVDLLATASGWGTTSARTILLQNNQTYINDTSNPPVGYTQFMDSSSACFYLRGGGKYFLKTDWIASWGIITSSITYGSQTVAPVTTYPNFSGLSVTLVDMNGYSSFTRAYGAVWNDYAEYRKDNPNEIQESGRCVKELGNGALALTTKRLERGCEIISDTFGFAIGQDEENGYNTPIASNGRVLAYPYESIEEFAHHIGWPVCSGPNGTVSIMTEEEEEKYPSRIIGTISEIPTYKTWGTGNVEVDGRIWIRIK